MDILYNGGCMKKVLILYIVFMITLIVSNKALAQATVEEATREADRSVREEVRPRMKIIPKKPKIEWEEDEGEESTRHKIEMRNLDRLYEEGALTKTEYIQRKRLLQEEK